MSEGKTWSLWPASRSQSQSQSQSPQNEAQRLQEIITGILRGAASEIESLIPDGAGASMALLDGRGVSYADILELPEEDQTLLLERRARAEFSWIVSGALKELSHLRP